MEEKQKKRKNILLKSIIIILIGVMLLFSKKENQEKIIDFIKASKITNKTLKVVESIPIEKKIDDISFYEKGIMIWRDKKLTRLKMDGSKEWEKQFNLDEPDVKFGENNIYVYEKSTGDIYFLNGAGETIHRVELRTSIDNMIESVGNILVHIKNSDREGISILDKTGKTIGDTLIKDGNVLTYCMGQDNITYAISTLNLKGKDLKSKIQGFRIGEESLFTTEFNNEIVLYSKFIKNDKLIVMTDKSLYFLNKGNILWEKQFQLIKDIYVDKEKINILYGNTLETISIDGRAEEKYSFTEEYKKIIPYDKYLILYGDEYIMGLIDGKKVFKYKSEETILEIVERKQNLIVTYKDKIQLMSL